MRAKFGVVPTAVSKMLSFKCISRLGVRSLANASRARQFNPLNPLGWGGYRFLKQIWQPWSVVRGHAWSCAVMRGRSCVVGHAWSCVVVRARSCVRGRSCVVVRGRSCVVVRGRSCAVVRAWSVIRGRAWSVVRGRAVLPASRPALPWHERTDNI